MENDPSSSNKVELKFYCERENILGVNGLKELEPCNRVSEFRLFNENQKIYIENVAKIMYLTKDFSVREFKSTLKHLDYNFDYNAKKDLHLRLAKILATREG